jgi:hypothetical protein
VAIDGITVMSNNPVFGLNAIGGPVSIAMKDGLASIVETDTRFGYYGRAMGSLQVGEKSGPFAAYLDDGYRDQGRGQDQLSQRKVVGLRGLQLRRRNVPVLADFEFAQQFPRILKGQYSSGNSCPPRQGLFVDHCIGRNQFSEG